VAVKIEPICRTEADFREYVSTIYVPKASASDLEPLWTLYPSDPPEGSPFNTGFQNILSPQFKRMAAFQGDIVFEAPRRFFLSKTSSSMKTWSYCMSFPMTPLNLFPYMRQWTNVRNWLLLLARWAFFISNKYPFWFEVFSIMHRISNQVSWLTISFEWPLITTRITQVRSNGLSIPPKLGRCIHSGLTSVKLTLQRMIFAKPNSSISLTSRWHSQFNPSSCIPY